MARNRSTLEEDLSGDFARRRARLRSIARRAGYDVEDIVQDSYVRLLETARRQDIRKVDNFLARIVRCVTIDRLRRRGSRDAVFSADARADAVDLAADPERTVMGAQRLQRVMAVIDEMPPKRREVFLLHRVEDLTYPQIAKRLGVGIKAVEKHMALAMRQLSDADD